MSDPPTRQDLPLSRTVIGRREVALRGPFRLRLASASRACFDPTQPRTRAGAMSGTLTAYVSDVRGVLRGKTHDPSPIPSPAGRESLLHAVKTLTAQGIRCTSPRWPRPHVGS